MSPRLPRDFADMLPLKEYFVEHEEMDDGSWLVTETKITRKIVSEQPSFMRVTKRAPTALNSNSQED